MTMIAEIYERVFAEMDDLGIPDTPENRMAMLQGLADGWREDPEFHPRKPFYQLALALEINRLSVSVHSRPV